MADTLSLQTNDGASRVTIADPTGSPLQAPVLEIGPAQALIATTVEFEANAYLDLTLELKGQLPRKFFAHVVGPEARGLRIRWMHLDPGEEQKLKGLLAAYARTSGGGGGGGHGTRRVIRPRSESVLPFGQSGGEKEQIEVELPATPAPPPPAATTKGSRRVIRAGARAEAPPATHEPTPAESFPGDESKGRPVVLATTDKFEQLRAIEEPASPPPSDPGPDPLDHEDPTPGARTAVIGSDGRMDVGAAIRSKAKTVRASELAARHDKVRVLNMATIKSLIQEAVEEAAAHLTRALGDAERKRLLEEAEEGFKERLKAFELDKKSAEEKARVLQADLNAAKELLEQERKRSIQADQFTVSEAGLADLDLRMMKIIERSVARGEAGPELELKLREMIAHILDSERERLKEKELAAHNDKIALLEKKVARLAHSLDETEKERDEARQIAEAMERDGLSVQEVRNKYRIGLAGDDPNRERKLALMRELVEQNRELRKQLGIKTRDPAEVAREQEAEDQRKRAEAEAARRELLADRAEAAAAAPAAAVPAADEAQDGDGAAETAADPGINPDDQPWEPPAKPAVAASEDDRGIKIMRSYKDFAPPPLQAPPADDGAPPANPDDQPWEPPAKG